jgi:cellulose biosynthesis protein BcsQ
MAKKIAMFNHKGGVSKTTTTFNLGWMLASQGKKVILVDADPQCNLSGLILGLKGEDEFDQFYEDQSNGNIRSGLLPAFESQPRAVSPVDCLEVNGQPGLYLLPGHIRLCEWEVTLGIAQELSASIQALQNLPGSISYLLDETANHYSADYIIIDMNPSLSSINQNLLMTSDFFIVPASPDYFSLMAIESLIAVLPRWHGWSSRAKQNPVLQSATYPFPTTTPKFLGTIIQKYRPRKGEPTIGFQKWIDEINDKVKSDFVPKLATIEMALPEEIYARAFQIGDGYCLSQIADFNTLITKSQDYRKPIFALSDDELESVGTVLENNRQKRQEFLNVFSQLGLKVLELTADAECA